MAFLLWHKDVQEVDEAIGKGAVGCAAEAEQARLCPRIDPRELLGASSPDPSSVVQIEALFKRIRKIKSEVQYSLLAQRGENWWCAVRIQQSKLPANAFLAHRVSSVNAFSTLDESTGANASVVAYAVSNDSCIGP
ncbi:hypothetical protein SUGI_0308660 [Cryptomeria japonica]|nr:hypothetical protein SUGI_0308660 [Cryptomeria japonica]